MSKKLALIGIILLVIGLFFAAVPEEMQKSFKIDIGLEKNTKMMAGAGLAVVGLILLVLSRKK